MRVALQRGRQLCNIKKRPRTINAVINRQGLSPPSLEAFKLRLQDHLQRILLSD